MCIQQGSALRNASNLTTDNFIQALGRVISRRGNVKMTRSDNGTNFVGTSIELKKAFGEMDEKRINSFLTELGGEWISWKRNPPMPSNMGGVWERFLHQFLIDAQTNWFC